MKKLILALVLTATPAFAADYNAYVLKAIRAMPTGGNYATNEDAGKRFIDAIHTQGGLSVDPSNAKPSFCTTATYLVLTQVIEKLWNEGKLASVSQSAIDQLLPPQNTDSLYHDDGTGVWGRWNANGPGTAKFFHDTRLGTNFESLSKAKAGDFLKIWWTTEVGGKERGHSVVFLGTRKNSKTGETELNYWSSNQEIGYSSKWIPLSKAKHMIFSRFDSPSNLNGLPALPKTDQYLKDCMSKDSSFDEAKAKSGVTD